MAGSVSGIQAGKAYVSLAVDDELDAGLKAGRAKLDAFKSGVEGVGKSWAGSLGGSVKAIRSEQRESGEMALERVLGRGTEGIASLLGGGVAAVGINLLSKGMKDAADEATRLQKELVEGKIGAGEVAERMLAAVPIFGEVWQAGRAIREVLNGEQLAIDLVNEAAKETVTYYDAQLARVRTIKGILQGMKSEGAHADIERANVGQDQYTQTANTISGGMQDRKDTYQQRLEQKRKEAGDAYDKEIEAQKSLAENALKQFKQVGMYDTPEEAIADAKGTPYHDAGAEAQRQQAIQAAQSALDEQQKYQKLLAQKGAATGKDSPIDKSFAAEEDARNAADAAKLQDNARRQWEEYGKIVRDGVQSASDEVAAAQIADLHLQGRNAEAQRLQIAVDARRRVEAIMRGAAEQAKAIGATSPWDPRFQNIMAVAGAQAGAVSEDAAAKTRAANQAEFEERAQKEEQLAELKAAAIANSYDREKAAIDAKYEYELKTAYMAGRDTADIEAKWNQERANLEEKHQRDVKTATENIDDEIAQEKVRTTKRGLDQQLALIEIERQKALRREADPATTAGIGADKINQLYDLQDEVARQHAGGVSGTFSGAASQAMFGGNIGGQKSASEKHAATTAKSTKIIADIVSRNQNGAAGLFFS